MLQTFLVCCRNIKFSTDKSSSKLISVLMITMKDETENEDNIVIKKIDNMD